MSVRTEAIGAPVAAVTADASLAWRRAALWGLLGAKVDSSWGVQWDIQWHTLIGDRKSTRLNSSHSQISYAVFCLKKKKKRQRDVRQSSFAGKTEVVRYAPTD